jgi:hypothetical protein
MKPFRLKELLRIIVIAAIAVVGGIVVLLTVWLSDPNAAKGNDGTLTLIFIFEAIFIFAIAFPTTILVGLVVHLILRDRSIPKWPLLPVFLVVGAVAGRVIEPNRWVVNLPLFVGTSGVAWLLYSFGPFRLWNFEFSPDEHSDF